MRHQRGFAILVAVAAAALPACTHDAIHTGKGDASAISPQPSDAPLPEPGVEADAAADAGGGSLADPSGNRDTSAPPADADASVGSGSETGGTEVGDVPGPASASLNLDKSTVNFGTLDVKNTGVATVTVTNTGKAASGTVTIIVSTGLTATGCTGALAAGASCTITITATPTAAGTFTGTVTISANPGAVTPLQVAVISSVVSHPPITVVPAAVDLGNVAVGAVAPKQAITITAGVAISDLTVTANGVDVSIDQVASTCTSMLAADASCIVVVSFVAVSAGSKTDAIVISGGGPAGKTVTVPITAIAEKPAQLVINPSTAQTFAASVGQTSSAITFGVANIGDVATGLINTAITGANAADFKAASTCLVLAPLAACTVAVTWSPSTVATTTETANLVVTDTAAGGSSVTVPLSSWGGGTASLVITPLSGDVGSALVGTTGAATIFTVTSSSDTALGSLTVAVSSTDFVVTNDTCTGASLVARTGTCTISIALKPATCGSKSTTLTVTGTNGNPAVKPITGVGITPDFLSASPAAVDFGSVGVNQKSTAQTITIKHVGCGSATGPLSFTKAGSFTEFSMTANTCSAGLGPGESCTFVLVFTPTTPGSQTAGFTVTDGSASATVLASGIGVSPI